MGRPGINYSNVAKAAAEIIAQGQVPTIERLRTKLETGSYSTLGALLKEWKAKQALQQQYAANSQLPDELITAVQKVWEVINEKTNDQLIKIREEAENDRQTYQQKINHEKELITAAEIAFRELNEKYRILSNEKSALEQALQEQHIQQAALLATQNSFEIQLSEKQARIDELLRLNQQVQNNLEHYRQASHEQRLLEQQQYETRHNELEQRNHKLQENWTSILTENTKIKSEFEQLFLVHEKLHNDQLKIGNEQIEKSKNLLETQQFLAEKTHLLEFISAQQKNDREKIEIQENKIIEFEKLLAAAEEKNKLQTKQINELASQNKLLAHEKWLLDCEKVRLMAEVEQVVKSAVAA